jgi:S1-C subfamily serine protease
MLRKQVLVLIIFLISIEAFPQKCNGYKDIIIPDLIYKDNKKDIFGIGKHLRNIFRQHGFDVISDISKSSEEIIDNKCLLLYCDYNQSLGYDGGSWGSKSTSGVVEIIIKDCEQNVLSQEIGSTLAGSSWNVVFQKSVDRALHRFFKSYRYDPKRRPNKVIPMFPLVNKINENEETIKEYLINKQLDNIEAIYTSRNNEFTPYFKIGIKKQDEKYIAVLLESDLPFWKVGEIKGIFEETSIEGVYSVEWYLTNKKMERTYAFLEHNKLLKVEVKNNDEISYITLIKSFPIKRKLKTNPKEKMIKSGSGFVISSNGIISTNAHVVSECDSILVTFTLGERSITYQARTTLIDKINDVALISIVDTSFIGFSKVPYTFSFNPKTGESVYAIGYPLSSLFGDELKVTSGIISSSNGINKDPRFIQITAPIQPGNSGGPLFNYKGEIIGIATSKFNDSFLNQDIENVNFAVKIAYLNNLYEMLPEKETINAQNDLVGLYLEDQISIIKEFICLVKAY